LWISLFTLHIYCISWCSHMYVRYTLCVSGRVLHTIKWSPIFHKKLHFRMCAILLKMLRFPTLCLSLFVNQFVHLVEWPFQRHNNLAKVTYVADLHTRFEQVSASSINLIGLYMYISRSPCLHFFMLDLLALVLARLINVMITWLGWWRWSLRLSGIVHCCGSFIKSRIFEMRNPVWSHQG